MTRARKITAAAAIAALALQPAVAVTAEVPAFAGSSNIIPANMFPGGALKAGDVNGDGRDDLVQEVYFPATRRFGIAVFPGRSDGQLDAPVVTTISHKLPEPSDVSVLDRGDWKLWQLDDLDGDGRDDLITYEGTCDFTICSAFGTPPESRQYVYRPGTAAGTFGAAVAITNVAWGGEFDTGDFDGDGDRDLIFTTRVDEVWRFMWSENDDGTFGAPQHLEIPAGWIAGVGDLGGSPADDLVFGTGDPWASPSTSSYTVIIDPGLETSSTGVTPTEYANLRGIGDIDGDGLDDLLVWSSSLVRPSGLAWHASNGDGTFNAATTIAGAEDMSMDRIWLANVADDGTSDIIWYNQTFDYRYGVTLIDPLGIDPTTVVYEYGPFFHGGPPAVGNFDGLGNNDVAHLGLRASLSLGARYHIVRFGATDTAGPTDSTDPTITINAPAASTVVELNSPLTASFTCADERGGSGILSCTINQAGTTGTSPFILSTAGLGQFGATITAVDRAGNTATATITYTVRPFTAPGAPVIGTATPGPNATASVSFTPPLDNGGTPITSYRASCTSSNGGTTRTASGVSSPITVTALSANRTYTCSVRATNVRGTSSASGNTSPFTLAGLPGAPTITDVAVTGSLRVSIGYAPPLNDGGSPITSTQVTCTPSTIGNTRSVTSSANPIVVTGLTAGSTYDCIARAINQSGPGAGSAPATVFVPDVPSAPVNVSAALSSMRRATISFDPPASDGGSPITNYRTTCTSPDGGTRTASGPASPHTVTSLTAGSSYTCTTRAANITGGSAASIPSAMITVPAPPSQPTLTAVSPAGARRVTVAFEPSASDGGSPITNYRAVCTSPQGTTRTSSRMTSPITVTLLTPAQTYTCSIIASNVAGASAPSNTSAPFVTP